MTSRGCTPLRSAAGAAGLALIAGALVALSVAGLAGGCGKRDRESPAAEGDKTPGRAGEATSPAPGGAPGARPGKAAGASKNAAPREKGAAGRAETEKRGKKGAPPPPAPVIPDVPASSLSDDQLAAQVEVLRRENARLAGEVSALEPQTPYILINTTLNRLSMKKGDQYILKDAVVSTGSNTELVDAKGNRRWFFSTPKGVHTVKKKMIAPVWTKPDWAFVEEGEPIPGAQAEARFEEGTLGKYGLYFGGGYIVHGTLFQRFLGQSVTHGCVRVGDADLETVYANASVGTKIYIY